MIPNALKPGPFNKGSRAMFHGALYRHLTIDRSGMVRLVHNGPDAPPDPAFVFGEAPSGVYWIAEVPAEECDWIASIEHRATYRGHPCSVVNVTDGGVGLYLIGDAVDAKQLGFETIEPYVHDKAVDFTELDDYYEIYSDDYFDYWQGKTFGFTMGREDWQDHLPEPELRDIAYPRYRPGRFAVVDGVRVAVEGDEPPAGASEFVDVSVVAAYQGADYDVVHAESNGRVLLRSDQHQDYSQRHGFVEYAPGRFEKWAHFGLLYHYREIHRNLLFDRWLAERATSQWR